jgi:hypothetical protein
MNGSTAIAGQSWQMDLEWSIPEGHADRGHFGPAPTSLLPVIAWHPTMNDLGEPELEPWVLVPRSDLFTAGRAVPLSRVVTSALARGWDLHAVRPTCQPHTIPMNLRNDGLR